MKAKPITLDRKTIRAVQLEIKTQLNIPITPQPGSSDDDGHAGLIADCPYGKVGDLLRVSNAKDLLLEITEVSTECRDNVWEWVVKFQPILKA